LQTIESLTQNLDYLPPEQISQVVDSYLFAKEAHEGQYRRSGDPYISHPLAVAHILSEMHMDHHSIMAAILHDVLEDTDVSKEVLAEKFNQTVAELVDGVSKIGAIKTESRAEAQAENLRKMVMAMTRDIRVILVKLADRLHNMRTLGVLHPQKRRRIAKETLDIYAPIANRLGMNNIRIELEDLGFTSLYPMRANRIKKAVTATRGNHTDMMNTIKQSLENRLQRDGVKVGVIGREKHAYSIYQKMRNQRKSFNQIMDVYGFRILVNDVDGCYRALGSAHNLYKPIPGRFKDYIAIAKANGYQSLHTTLKGISGAPVEIQIRTREMEAMANNGIAAHWLYKSDPDPAGGAQNRAKEWFKSLLEMQQNTGSSLEFIENVKMDLFPDAVYVFTPKGNIIELPTGATPVDFAYAVHSDVGNSCVAARIDHRLAPLSSQLQSGQSVQIITAPGALPNPTWLNFVVTSKARSNIRHLLKNQRRSESIALGKRLLEKALGSFELELDTLPANRLEKALSDAGIKELDDLLEEIGLGNQMAQISARRLLPPEKEEENIHPTPESAQQRPLIIHGTEGLVINFSKCCHPIPGDSIIGHLSSGRGMVIHLDDCKNISTELKANPEKCLSVQWSEKIDREFPVELRVEMMNERGALATLATVLSDVDANIETINLADRGVHISVGTLCVAVKDRTHLARAIKRLRQLNAITKISRSKN